MLGDDGLGLLSSDWGAVGIAAHLGHGAIKGDQARSARWAATTLDRAEMVVAALHHLQGVAAGQLRVDAAGAELPLGGVAVQLGLGAGKQAELGGDLGGEILKATAGWSASRSRAARAAPSHGLARATSCWPWEALTITRGSRARPAASSVWGRRSVPTPPGRPVRARQPGGSGHELTDQVLDGSLVAGGGGGQPVTGTPPAVSAALGASGQLERVQPGRVDQGQPSQGVGVEPLDLACRDHTRRRSWALAELTRYTVCPRAPKKHRDRQPRWPSRLHYHRQPDPGLAPTRAAWSTSTKLARVGPPCAGPRSGRRPKAPARCGRWRSERSIPTSRRSCTAPPCWLWPAPAAPMAVLAHDHGPKVAVSDDGSHACAATGPGLGRAGRVPHPGHRLSTAGHGWQSGQPGMATARRPQRSPQPHPGTSRDAHATLEPRCRSSTAAPYMSCKETTRQHSVDGCGLTSNP